MDCELMSSGPAETLEYFYSFRSPYSYLSAPRAFMLPMRFEIDLHFRGVIPMVMRGQSVPRAKGIHTLRDGAREARRLGMPFGPMHDPVGEGAMRCLLIAAYAREEGAVREFVLQAGGAIWGRAADVASDDGLRPICEHSGLRWEDCERALIDPRLLEIVEADTSALGALGHWGVPVFVFRGELFWGQDRIVDLERSLARAGLRRRRGSARFASERPPDGMPSSGDAAGR
jgi:2-hydroxychromene-2-carboxylate isomerase